MLIQLEESSGGGQTLNNIDDLVDTNSNTADTVFQDALQQLGDSEQFRRSAALFILKTAEVRRFTLTAVNGILEDVQELV